MWTEERGSVCPQTQKWERSGGKVHRYRCPFDQELYCIYLLVGEPWSLPRPCLHHRQRRLQVRKDRRKLQVSVSSIYRCVLLDFDLLQFRPLRFQSFTYKFSDFREFFTLIFYLGGGRKRSWYGTSESSLYLLLMQANHFLNFFRQLVELYNKYSEAEVNCPIKPHIFLQCCAVVSDSVRSLFAAASRLIRLQ